MKWVRSRPDYRDRLPILQFKKVFKTNSELLRQHKIKIKKKMGPESLKKNKCVHAQKDLTQHGGRKRMI